MDTPDIISSGLLELYAAGIASEKEMQEVEQWVAQYPEVAEELQKITQSMETYVHAHAIAPADGIKEKIFARIQTNENGKVIPLASKADIVTRRIDPNLFWKIAAAASLLLLIGSIALNIVTYNRYSEADKNLFAAQETLNTLEEKNKDMAAGMDIVQNKYSVPVSLKGLEAAPNAAAKIFWIQNTGEVFIDPSNLPEAPQGKQYQLWGIVDGQPVDGGMILTTAKGEKYHLQKMKTFGKVEAFAVTLEPEKGNPTPKGPMFVMGKM
ncbi:MAG: anti-sigma factor [Ferruginibacter sp.]